MNQLLNACLPFARQMIERHGEFHPFGPSIATDGQIRLEAADPGHELPGGQRTIGLLTEGLREKALRQEITAAAICANIEMTGPDGQSEAIQVAVEHQNSRSGARVHALPEKWV